MKCNNATHSSTRDREARPSILPFIDCQNARVIIETERLQLQALTPEGAAEIVAGVRLPSWAQDYPTPGDVRVAAFALEGNVAFANDDEPWGLYVVVERSSDLAIGGIGFKTSPNDRGEVEIGYGICESFQGRGVATEAVIAVCQFARVGAHAVLAETERVNIASQRVLEKAGFVANDAGTELIGWRKELSGAAI